MIWWWGEGLRKTLDVVWSPHTCMCIQRCTYTHAHVLTSHAPVCTQIKKYLKAGHLKARSITVIYYTPVVTGQVGAGSHWLSQCCRQDPRLLLLDYIFILFNTFLQSGPPNLIIRKASLSSPPLISTSNPSPGCGDFPAHTGTLSGLTVLGRAECSGGGSGRGGEGTDSEGDGLGPVV